MSLKSTSAAAAAGLVLLAGCAKYDENVAEIGEATAAVEERLAEIREPEARDRRTSSVRISEGVWLGASVRPVSSGNLLPRSVEGRDGFVLSRPAGISFDELSFLITDATGISVALSPDIDDLDYGFEQGVFYSGPLSRFLDGLSSAAGVNWTYDPASNRVEFYEFVTRAFKVHGFGETTIAEESNSDDLWEGIVEGLEAIIGEDGEVEDSAAAGYMIVTTTPSRMRSARRYIEEQNAERLRQIVIHVAVFTVALDDEQAVGINLETAFERLNGRFNLGGGSDVGGTSATFEVLEGVTSSPGRYLVGSEITASALGKLGNVSTVTSASLTTLNDQPVPLDITSSTNYISGTSSTRNEDGSVTYTTSTSTFTGGVEVMVRPRVLPDNRVRLDFTLEMTELLRLTSVSSGDNTVQLPQVSSRTAENQIVLRNGSTLVLSGFERTRDEAERTGPHAALWVLGGSTSGDDSREVSVVTIQPIVLEDTGLVEVPLSSVRG